MFINTHMHLHTDMRAHRYGDTLTRTHKLENVLKRSEDGYERVILVLSNLADINFTLSYW